MRLYEGLDENGEKIFNTYTGKKEKLKKYLIKKIKLELNKLKVKKSY